MEAPLIAAGDSVLVVFSPRLNVKILTKLQNNTIVDHVFASRFAVKSKETKKEEEKRKQSLWLFK